MQGREISTSAQKHQRKHQRSTQVQNVSSAHSPTQTTFALPSFWTFGILIRSLEGTETSRYFSRCCCCSKTKRLLRSSNRKPTPRAMVWHVSPEKNCVCVCVHVCACKDAHHATLEKETMALTHLLSLSLSRSRARAHTHKPARAHTHTHTHTHNTTQHTRSFLSSTTRRKSESSACVKSWVSSTNMLCTGVRFWSGYCCS